MAGPPRRRKKLPENTEEIDLTGVLRLPSPSSASATPSVHSTSDPSNTRESSATVDSTSSGEDDKVGAQSSTSEDDSRPKNPPIQPALKGHSPTALGRTTFQIQDPPDLYVVEVKTYTEHENGKDKDPIKSKKLRRLALEELLSTQHFRNVKSNVTIHYSAKQHTDHFILPLGDEKMLASIKSTFRKIKSSGVITLSETKIKTRREREDSAGKVTRTDLTEKSIKCVIGDEVDSDSESATKLYCKSLQTLVKSKTQDLTQRLIFEGLERDFFGFKTHIRAEPKIELSGGEALLHLDFDVAPFVDQTLLHQAVLEFFGNKLLGSGAEMHLPTLKGMLVGMKVQCNYGSKDYTEPPRFHGKELQIGIFPPRSPTPTPTATGTSSRTFRIRDVKMPGDVPKFSVNGKDSKLYSVAGYFEEIIFDKQRKLDHPKLPLAKVAKDCWIPLEMLQIMENPQFLKKVGHLTKYIQDMVHSEKEEFRECMRRYGADFKTAVDDFRHTEEDTQLLHLSEGVPYPSRLLDSPPAVSDSGTSKKLSRVSKNTGRIQLHTVGIVYVAPKDSTMESVKDVINTTKQWLSHALAPYKNPTIADATVSSLEDLLVHSRYSSNRISNILNPIKGNATDFILAIIDKNGRTKEEIKNFEAELQKFGNRTVGAAVICTTWQSLVDYRRTLGGFPPNLLRKMNFMLGGTNFETQPLSLPEGGCMIVGAHISHPDSKAVNHCPSVAAVVASHDNEGLHYPGSARAQLSLRSVSKDSKGKSKRITESSILALKDMMKERFEAQQLKAGRPANVLFYRGSISFDDSAAIRQEIKGIKEAFAECWPDEPDFSLTYVVVNKNCKIPNTISDQMQPSFGFTTEEADSEAKYQYYVMENAMELDPERLKAITVNINKGSQLHGVSFALPVHFAKKLCHRMFDYFRFYITRDFGMVSSIIRATPSSDPVEAEREMLRVLNNYLSAETIDNKEDEHKAKTEIDEQPRTNPWQTQLDDKMFYL